MDALAALILATPLFGLSLAPPAGDAALLGRAAPAAEAIALAPEQGPSPAVRAGEAERLARLRTAHRAMGIVTWAAMTATVAIGAVQLVDRYGAGALAETRCARGDPLLGAASCELPLLHIVGASLTTAAYAATFGLSMAMRDPASSPGGAGGRASRLRMHRALRWVHLAGMASQVVGGVVFANLGRMGVDEAESYDVLRGLSIYHLVVGGITWAALTWAGALLVAG